MSWQALEAANPDLAAFGKQRLHGLTAYLATVDKAGHPRVHPVTPIIGEGRLFLFMEPTSPKGFDVKRNGRFALHCAVENNEGGAGEFYIRGTGRFTDNPDDRAAATRISAYSPHDRYILFEFDIHFALSTHYSDDGPQRVRWKRNG
ncbi:MAG: pyridoxamine 5'-phosphate oxidase family protein [Chloroflexota bacterium]